MTGGRTREAGPPATPTTVLDAHVAALSARLRGPRRLRAGMLAEARAGLDDATRAHELRGLDPAAAHRAALAEFGAVEENAPAHQEQLLVAQGRATARVLLATFPGLLIGWDLLWSTGTGWTEAPPVVVALARAQDATSVAVGAAAVVALALLARSARRPGSGRRTAAAIGVVGGLAVVSATTMSVVMSTVGGAGHLLAEDPMAVAAYAVTGVAMVLVVRSVARTLRLVLREPHPVRRGAVRCRGAALGP